MWTILRGRSKRGIVRRPSRTGRATNERFNRNKGFERISGKNRDAEKGRERRGEIFLKVASRALSEGPGSSVSSIRDESPIGTAIVPRSFGRKLFLSVSFLSFVALRLAVAERVGTEAGHGRDP